ATIPAFCSAVHVRRRPVPVNTSSRRAGSALDLDKSSVSDTYPTYSTHGRTFAHQPSALKVGNKDRLHLMIASTVVLIPIWLQSRMSLTAGQHEKAYQKRDTSLLRCTLRSQQQLARAEFR